MRTFLSTRLRTALSTAAIVAVATSSTVSPAAAQTAAPVPAFTAPLVNKQQQDAMLLASIGAIIAALATISFLAPSSSNDQSSASQSTPVSGNNPHDGKPGHHRPSTSGTGTPRSANTSDDNTDTDRDIVAPRSGQGTALLGDPKEPGQPAIDTDQRFPDSQPLEHGGPYSVNSARDEIYKTINEQRAHVGLPLLHRDHELEESANGSAEYMKQTTRALGESKVNLDYFSDALSTWPSALPNPNSITPAQILWSSTYNLAPSLFIPAVVKGNNPEAKSVIVPKPGSADTTFTHVGVGVTRDPNTGRWFFVLRFIGPKKHGHVTRPLI